MPNSSVIKTRLSNGLTVHLKEIHNAPIISHWVWYRVGSRDEVPGLTGISHWVEHMLFKGTPAFPAGILDKAISRVGGTWNAFTYLDWTTYFETLPADKVDLALQIEADRMVNSVFDPAEVESERTVIISEREGSENEPLSRLSEAIQSSAFDTHAYKHEVIGDKADLLRIQRDDLYHHYRTHYTPNNAVLAMAGDFEADDMLARIQNRYGGLVTGIQPERTSLVEKPLGGERRLEISGPGQTTYLQVAYRAPAASNPDFFAFSVLDSLLTGPTSLNMFGGGGISNKTCRLYHGLVESELAVSIHGGMQATLDPFLYDMTVTIRPDKTVAQNLSVIDDEIKRLQDTPVSADEIARAVKQARALFAYGSENITNQAFWLGYAEMFDRYDWFVQYVERLEQVTAEEIQKIACSYLHPSNRVVGVYLPTGNDGPDADEGGDE